MKHKKQGGGNETKQVNDPRSKGSRKEEHGESGSAKSDQDHQNHQEVKFLTGIKAASWRQYNMSVECIERSLYQPQDVGPSPGQDFTKRAPESSVIIGQKT